QLAPLSLVISTQAPSDDALLSVLIDDALAGHDPRVICSLYTAPPDADPFDIETIKFANPALGTFQNPEEILAMARDAKRMPAREAAFRNHALNQRVEASSPFVTSAQWKACAGEPLDLRGRDDLESIILEKKLRHGDHPVLTMCASNAVIDRDPAGNRKLSKKRSTGRIDGMTALLMAFGAAAMRTTVQFDVEALIA